MDRPRARPGSEERLLQTQWSLCALGCLLVVVGGLTFADHVSKVDVQFMADPALINQGVFVTPGQGTFRLWDPDIGAGALIASRRWHWPEATVGVLVGGLGLWIIWLSTRMLRRINRQCEQCGYPLGKSARCTECGCLRSPASTP